LQPVVSIVICTRNRAASLEIALRSLIGCEQLSPSVCEVVVVDNGSSDATRTVAEAFHSTLPLRYVVEAEAGLANARNCGVQVAHGEWLIWLDDDVTVEAGWLAAYLEAIAAHPDAQLLGGLIVAEFGDPLPVWLHDGLGHVGDAFGVRDQPRFDGQILLAGPKPYGANFALRRDAAAAHPFDP
jgi:glycosyltransferase involved in cell wall biosynthesis